jgi:preprotein translocase subunit SecF
VDISLMFVERWAFFIGIMLVIAGSLINGFLAFLYNVGSDLVGGLEMTFSERDA